MDMGDLACVLELLHDAQPRWKTLRAVGREWRHNLLLAEVSERHFAAVQAGQPPGTAFQIIGYGPDGRSSLPDESEDPWRLWLEHDGRRRVEYSQGAAVITVVFDGPTWWSWSPDVAARTNGGLHNHQHGSGPSETLIDSSALLSALRLQFVGSDTLRGRDIFRVRGLPRARSAHEPNHILYGLGADADDYMISVDAERGVVLRSEARLREEPFAVIEMTEMEFDVDLPPATFVIDLPEGETFEDVSQHGKAHWPRRSRLSLGLRRDRRFSPPS
jgi:outer membrane lipoprotein-sorting protein